MGVADVPSSSQRAFLLGFVACLWLLTGVAIWAATSTDPDNLIPAIVGGSVAGVLAMLFSAQLLRRRRELFGHR
jgi:hypothetical protein